MAKGEGGMIFHYSRGIYRADDENGGVLGEKVLRVMREYNLQSYWEDEFFGKTKNHLLRHLPFLWDTPPQNEICLKNGIFNLEEMEFRPHSPEWLSQVQIPIKYDPSQRDCGVWDAFHLALFPEECVEFILEFEASLLTPRAMSQSAIWLRGEGGNGKSTFVGALQKIIGRNNFGTFNLKSLESDRFSVAELNGKLLAVDYDAAKKRIRDASLIKKLITLDPIQAQKKNLPLFTMTPTAKLLFLSNHYIESDDKSPGFRRRFLTVPMERTFEPGQTGFMNQSDLWAALGEERQLSGLLNKLILSWRSLRERGAFQPPLPVKTATEHFNFSNHPLVEYVEGNVRFIEGRYSRREEFRKLVNEWAKEKGYPEMDESDIGRFLNWRFPEMPKEKKIPIDGKQERVYWGIAVL